MKLYKRRTDQNLGQELKFLETQLAATFQQVLPRPEFVSDLRSRLATREIQPVSALLPQKVSNGLLVAGGILGGLLMIITGIRGLISLVGVVGLVFQFFTRNTQRRQLAPAS